MVTTMTTMESMPLKPVSIPHAVASVTGLTTTRESVRSSSAQIETPIIEIDRVDFAYGAHRALNGVSLKIAERKVTAFIGPSGCGKSTLLRCLNRMNDLIEDARVTSGSIRIRGVDINSPAVDVIELRKRVGMVFQKSNPFPKSIYENIAFGLRLQGITDKARLDAVVEK